MGQQTVLPGFPLELLTGIAAAGVLGLYPNAPVALASGLAAVPAVSGVAVGKRLRSNVSDSYRRTAVLGLLTVIGIRLVLGELGIA